MRCGRETWMPRQDVGLNILAQAISYSGGRSGSGSTCLHGGRIKRMRLAGRRSVYAFVRHRHHQIIIPTPRWISKWIAK